MKLRHWILLIIGSAVVITAGFLFVRGFSSDSKFEVGQQIDELDGVAVYYNGKVGNVTGRNLADNGYNLGLKYQCVEFVKRYYFEHFNHEMPDSYGHAKDFFDKNLKDGQYNKRRNLFQYSNPSESRPKEGDLLIFDKTIFNSYGHVAIVSKVMKNKIEIIQQNPGPLGRSREVFRLRKEGDKWRIGGERVLGWLRRG